MAKTTRPVISPSSNTVFRCWVICVLPGRRQDSGRRKTVANKTAARTELGNLPVIDEIPAVSTSASSNRFPLKVGITRPSFSLEAQLQRQLNSSRPAAAEERIAHAHVAGLRQREETDARPGERIDAVVIGSH